MATHSIILAWEISWTEEPGGIQLCAVCAKSLRSCLTLYDPKGFSPPAPSVHGILQAGKLEWVATPSSRGSFQPLSLCLLNWKVGSLPLVPPGNTSRGVAKSRTQLSD